MRHTRLICFSILLLVWSAAGLGQVISQSCPTIRIIGPAGITQPGDEMSFVAEVAGVGLDVKYEWAVTSGKIVSGQGTPVIQVLGEQGASVQATVKLLGVANGCQDTASGNGTVAEKPPSCSLDEWKRLKPNDERGRFDVFFAELLNNPENLGVLVFTGIRPEKRNSNSPKIKFFVKHAKFRNFDLSRVVFLFSTEDSGYESTVLYRAPPGAELPFPSAVVVHGRSLK